MKAGMSNKDKRHDTHFKIFGEERDAYIKIQIAVIRAV